MPRESTLIKWTIWVLAAVFYFYEFLLRISPSVMVPELMSSFGITASSVGVLSAFYLYAYAPMQLPVGILMDRYGIKKILSAASIILEKRFDVSSGHVFSLERETFIL